LAKPDSTASPERIEEWLNRPIHVLKGVGREMERKLGNLGITTTRDLVHHYPRRYDDFSKIIPIRAMRPGLVTFRGQIERIAARYAKSRRLHITEAIIADGTGTIKAVWFNQPYLAKSLPIGTEVLVSGKVEFRNSDLALQSPAVEPMDEGRETRNVARIVPVYPETAGLSSRQLRALIQPLLPMIESLPETLPEQLIKDHKLMSRGKALHEIHFPTTPALLDKARRRIAFEELWFIMLAALAIKQEIQTEEAPAIPFQLNVVKDFTEVLDFDLTDAQRKAAWSIYQDLGREVPMNRLLEGDVGSGKTVVATMAAVMALAAGHQAAMMVPTEILARQHFARLKPLLGKLGYQVELLTGKQTVAEKKAVREIASSPVPIMVIGTQALLSEATSFNNLALVIIDEQHRFGVGQRQTLKAKAGRLPHLLSMTATPIPRSLQLTVYGDLDITVIDSLPPGRQPIETRVTPPKKREAAYAVIEEELGRGHQAYVICPQIDVSDTGGSKSVIEEAERLRKGPFKHRRIGLLHGKLKADEKQAVMEQFSGGEIDILVATTVIEVGVDVRNATVMLVEAADRFGLAALHQLRGRVGRGEYASYCFLVPAGREDNERLAALERSGDGFRLAQIDLELRGPGQIYGRRQHGDLDLQMADLGDTKLIAEARKAAQAFLTEPDRMLQYPQIAARVNALKSVTSLD
jgi:ATP-dependent DNA helicase RecG